MQQTPSQPAEGVGGQMPVAAAAQLRGPLPPMAAGRDGVDLRPMLGPVLAFLFVVVAALLFVRRRGARRAPAQAGPPSPPPGLLDGPADALYAWLLQRARDRLGPAARCATPAEIARLATRNGDVPERRHAAWRALCRHAELARYAGADVAEADRRADWALMVGELTPPGEG